MTKKLAEYSYEYIQENLSFVVNVECDYILGVVDDETAEEICGEYDDIFPLSFEPLIDDNKLDIIENNKQISKDKIKRNIYEEVFDENDNVKPQYLE